MGVLLYKHLKITTKSGAVYFLGYEGIDGLRGVSRIGGGGPLPFRICTLEGCGHIDDENTPDPNPIFEQSVPVVGKRLILRPDKTFEIDPHSLPRNCCVTSPIVKIENC